MRRAAWLGLGVLALAASWVGYRAWASRPHESAFETMRREAAAASRARAADPATHDAESAQWSAFDALMAVTPLPDATRSVQEKWLEAQLEHDPIVPPATPAAHAAALRRQTQAWQAARPLDEAALATTCPYLAPDRACHVVETGIVPGSAGALRFQRQDRPLGPAQADEAAAAQDAMGPDMLAIFASAETPGTWRMALALDDAPGHDLREVQSPAGPLLQWSSPPQDVEVPAMYAQVEGRWRYLYPGPWQEGLAGRAPSGTCLRGAFYAFDWPRPPILQPGVFGGAVPDWPTLTYEGVFADDDRPVARVHATLAIQGQSIELRQATVETVGAASLLSKLLQDCGRR